MLPCCSGSRDRHRPARPKAPPPLRVPSYVNFSSGPSVRALQRGTAQGRRGCMAAYPAALLGRPAGPQLPGGAPPEPLGSLGASRPALGLGCWRSPPAARCSGSVVGARRLALGARRLALGARRLGIGARASRRSRLGERLGRHGGPIGRRRYGLPARAGAGRHCR